MQGQLFTSDFLLEGIRTTTGWNDSEAGFIDFRRVLLALAARFESDLVLNEAQTEAEIIDPVLKALGWISFLRGNGGFG